MTTLTLPCCERARARPARAPTRSPFFSDEEGLEPHGNGHMLKRCYYSAFRLLGPTVLHTEKLSAKLRAADHPTGKGDVVPPRSAGNGANKCELCLELMLGLGTELVSGNHGGLAHQSFKFFPLGSGRAALPV